MESERKQIVLTLSQLEQKELKEAIEDRASYLEDNTYRAKLSGKRNFDQENKRDAAKEVRRKVEKELDNTS